MNGIPAPPAAGRTRSPRRPALLVVLALVLGAVGLLVAAPSADAAETVTVTTNLDITNAGDGLTSLREAFAQAQADGAQTTIQLPAGAALGLTNCSGSGGQLTYNIDQALTIEGNGATVTQTCPGHRVMSVATPNQPVIINDLAITGGDVTDLDGAGLWANAPLTITGSRFANNDATGINTKGGALRSLRSSLIMTTTFADNSAGDGGAISTTANVHLTRSIIAQNEAGQTGGITAGGSTATLVTSVVTGNTSLAHATGGVAGTDVILRNATVAGNTGSAFVRTQVYVLETLTAIRSVVADPGPSTANCTVGMSTVSQGFNHASDSSCGFTAPTDLAPAGPVGFGTMAAPMGGYSLAVVPPQDSVLVDAVPTANCDGTYVSDLTTGARPQGDGCEVGAVEIAPPPPVYCAGLEVTVDLGDGDVPSAGPDVIRGTSGDDTVNALGGDDRFCGLGGSDTFNGGPGFDRAYGGQGADVLRGGANRDVLEGGGGNDRLYGQLGNDTLRGLSGTDVLEGGNGNDQHHGGPQRDTCRGQAGRDTQVACEARTGFP